MDIITFTELSRLNWAGHVVRMEKQRPAKRILIDKPVGRRRRERPKLRWEDVKALRERN
jgi:hypothetical protein